jgi:hypothetical protein
MNTSIFAAISFSNTSATENPIFMPGHERAPTENGIKLAL